MSILAHSRGSTTREQMKNCFCRHHSPRNKSRRHHKHRSCDHTVINFSNKLKHVLHIPSTRLSKEPKTFFKTTDVRRPGEFEKNPLSSEQWCSLTIHMCIFTFFLDISVILRQFQYIQCSCGACQSIYWHCHAAGMWDSKQPYFGPPHRYSGLT